MKDFARLQSEFQRAILEGDDAILADILASPSQTRAVLFDVYRDASVPRLLHVMRESYGLTVREALSRDVWVISTAPGGQSEEIVDGVNGSLIPIINDPAPLQAAVEAILDQQERFDHYVNPNKASLPNYEDQAAELAALYNSLLKRSG